MDTENIIIINGLKCSFSKNETILETALRNGIKIPSLCYLSNTVSTGKCKICLVEIEGEDELVLSCQTVSQHGMVVKTDTPKIAAARRARLEELISSGHHNCLVQEMDINSWTDFQRDAMALDIHRTLCPAYGECRLQDLAIQYRARPVKAAKIAPPPVEDVNPFIVRDFSRCILCGRCVKACNEVQVNRVINFNESESKVITKDDLPLKDSNCVFCGECVQVCPVGALVPKRDFEVHTEPNTTKKIRTTCSYCGVGCQIYIHVKDNQIVKVTGVDNFGPNRGSLCVKGRFGFDFVQHPARLTTPLIRKGKKLKEATWDEALDYIADKLGYLKDKYGPDSIGVLTSARITNEENYLAQKFARAVIGTNNIDHCARL